MKIIIKVLWIIGALTLVAFVALIVFGVLTDCPWTAPGYYEHCRTVG